MKRALLLFLCLFRFFANTEFTCVQIFLGAGAAQDEGGGEDAHLVDRGDLERTGWSAFRPASTATGPARIWGFSAPQTYSGNVSTELPPSTGAQRSDGFWLDWRGTAAQERAGRPAAAGQRREEAVYGSVEGGGGRRGTDGPWLLATSLGRLTLAAGVAASTLAMALLVWQIGGLFTPLAAGWVIIPPENATFLEGARE